MTKPIQLSDTNVQLNKNGDVLFLSTFTNNSNKNATGNAELATRSASATKSGTLDVANRDITIPTGFANDFGTLINGVLSAIMLISVLLVFFYLIWGAFDWITSGGDKAKVDSARNKITSAIIGILIVASSFAVLNLIIRFLGFMSLNELLSNLRTIS